MRIVFYLTLFFFILGYSISQNNIDYDFFARLIVGKTYFQTGSVLKWDFLSYTPTHPFIDHEWGSGVIFYFLQSNLNEIGLLLFKAITYIAIFFIITRIILLHKKDTEFHFLPFFLLINTIPMIIFSTIRCQMFSFFFFVLWLYVLERIRVKNQTRLIWIIPSTMILWGNLHGGCFSGIGLLILYIIGEKLNKKEVRIYLLALILSILALLINPYGIKYLEFLFYAITLNREFITEWMSTFSLVGLANHAKFIIFIVIFWIISLIYIIKNTKGQSIKEIYSKLDKTKAIIVFATMVLAIKSIRLQAFFIFSLFAFCYNDFYALFNKKLPKIIDNTKEIIFLILTFLFAASSLYLFEGYCSLKNFPIGEIEFLKVNNIKGNLLCEFHHGSFATYKLYPNNLIFMDGRYEEVYPNNLIYSLRDFNIAKDNWQEEIKKYNTQIIIASKKYPIYKKMQENKDFTQVTQSKYFGLFLKNNLVRDDFKNIAFEQEYYMREKFNTKINWGNNEK